MQTVANNVSDNREALLVLSGTGASTDPWTSKTESLVTQNVFSTSFFWRMGCLAFTRNNTALNFWAGYALSYPTSYYQAYVNMTEMSGSMYSYTLGGTNVLGILGYTDGGHIDVSSGGAKTYNS